MSLAIAFHTSFNTADSVLFGLFRAPPVAREAAVYGWTVALTWVVAAVVLVVWRARPVSEPLAEPGPAPAPQPGLRRLPRAGATAGWRSAKVMALGENVSLPNKTARQPACER